MANAKAIVTQWATAKLDEADNKAQAELLLSLVADDTGKTMYQYVDDVIRTRIVDVGHPSKVLLVSKTGPGSTDVDFEIIDITRL